jgi:chemotaxis protein histidine kinase CheA
MELRETMLLEFNERIDQLEQCLKMFDGKLPIDETINDLIRVLHSLKGLFGMVGFSQISQLFHNMKESLTNYGGREIENLHPFMQDLYTELIKIYKTLSQKEELNIKGISKITEQVTFLLS